MQTDLEVRRQVETMLRAYRESQVLITCAELGVFDALARLLDSAASLRLVHKEGDTYLNSPLAAACLAPGGPAYLGNLVKREGAFYRRWGRLAEAVRSGQRPEENTRDERQGDWVRGFELALFDVSRLSGPPIAEALAPFVRNEPGRAVRVIDIGGGHGGYSMALARRYPQLEAVVFDLPPVMDVARELIAASGVSERMRAQPGDFKTAPLGGDYDLALLFGVLVSEPAPDAVALLRKVSAALRPGGHVAIRGFYLNPERSGPPGAALFDLQMLLSTGAGRAHSLDELSDWLRQAGFASPAMIDIPSELSSLLVAAKATA